MPRTGSGMPPSWPPGRPPLAGLAESGLLCPPLLLSFSLLLLTVLLLSPSVLLTSPACLLYSSRPRTYVLTPDRDSQGRGRLGGGGADPADFWNGVAWDLGRSLAEDVFGRDGFDVFRRALDEVFPFPPIHEGDGTPRLHTPEQRQRAAAASRRRSGEGYGESAEAEAHLEAMGLTVFRRPEPAEGGEGPSTSPAGLDWASLAGYERIKKEVEDAVVLSFRYPSVFEAIAKGTRQRPDRSVPRAVLFEGPPGTGKTTTARILAAQCDAPLVYLPLESILSKWYGESEQHLARVFSLCRKLAPGVLLFVDEVDALAPSRDAPGPEGGLHEASRRMMSILLRHVDGFGAAPAPARPAPPPPPGPDRL
eukprot:tig00021603_g22814.t1